jgi:hypothetical protein
MTHLVIRAGNMRHFLEVVHEPLVKGMRVSSGATEREISVTGFGTTEFRSEVAGRRSVEVYEIMHWAA